MGTVGVNIHVFIQGGITLWSVKLNNPLMGTETLLALTHPLSVPTC